jgi:hypothetical protein
LSDQFQPFADNKSVAIGELTIENSSDRVSLYGSIDLTRDKPSLARARELKALVDAIVVSLADDGTLPDNVPSGEKPTIVRNPFK